MRTTDRTAPEPARFYTTLQLGEKRHLTPDGFLLCEDVPIARTGPMEYGPGETPLDSTGGDFVTVDRDEDEVFRPETIASFNGKPVVFDHPDDDVTPANWRQLSGGVVLNPRRGEGDDADLLLADLLITVPELIEAIQKHGMREVSCGYDAEYEQTGPRRGKQTNIIGNHVALVDRGRCGPRCSIGDHQPSSDTDWRATTMSKRNNGKTTPHLDRVRKAFRDGNEEELLKALEEGRNAIGDELEEPGDEGGDTHVHVHLTSEPPAAGTSDEGEGGGEAGVDQRLAALEAGHQELKAMMTKLLQMQETDLGRGPGDSAEGSTEPPESAPEDQVTDEEMMKNLEEEAPEGTGDRARKARDSAYLQDSYQETVALAEILVPGSRAPTFDRAASPKASFTAICGFRRRVLDAAWHAPDTQEILYALNGNRTIDTKRMTCDSVRTLFRGAAQMKAQKNRDNGTSSGGFGPGMGTGVRGGVRSLADLNEANAKHYANQQ